MKRIIEFSIFGIILTALSYFAADVSYANKIIHTIGGIGVAWLFEPLFLKNYSSRKSIAFWLSLIGIASFVGILWEFAEHLSSVYSPIYLPKLVTYFYGGGISDTLKDLASDILGSLLFLTYRSRS